MQTEIQKASTVWPESFRPARSVTVTETITGPRKPSYVEDPLDREERGLGVEGVENGLQEEQVDPAVEKARA